MAICFFGYPNQDYSRNQILIKGLRQNGSQVAYCTDKSGLFLTRYWHLFKKFWPLRHQVDVIFVQFPGQLNVPIAWFLGKIFDKPVIFDAFVSLYDTYVFDRLIASPGSFKAKFYWWVDKLACTLADHVTLDTNAHIRYFVRTFHLSHRKFSRLPVGGDDSVFKPHATSHKPQARPERSRRVIVEFHGMFTRLHGAEIFIQAAKQLEHHKNLEFWLIGDNPGYRYPIELFRKLNPKTMTYWPALPVKQLARKIAQADISIGHLGPTQKARTVLTNKMFHALSARTTLIAGSNPATKEFLQDKVNCLYTKMYSVTDLTQKILFLAKNPRLRHQLAASGYKLHQQQFTNYHLGLELVQIIGKHFPHII